MDCYFVNLNTILVGVLIDTGLDYSFVPMDFFKKMKKKPCPTG